MLLVLLSCLAVQMACRVSAKRMLFCLCVSCVVFGKMLLIRASSVWISCGEVSCIDRMVSWMIGFVVLHWIIRCLVSDVISCLQRWHFAWLSVGNRWNKNLNVVSFVVFLMYVCVIFLMPTCAIWYGSLVSCVMFLWLFLIMAEWICLVSRFFPIMFSNFNIKFPHIS